MTQEGSIETLVLDLEGTLILNAANPVRRPGLFAFLEFCRSRFPRVVVFTAVETGEFRRLAREMAATGDAPSWFVDVERYCWDYRLSRYKDLRAIEGAVVARTVIVDDAWQVVDPDQRQQWIEIVPMNEATPGTDGELTRLTVVLGRLARP